MLTVTVLLLVCALVALVAHVLKPNVPLWVTVLFIIVILLLQVAPIK
jgi:hypothetical protein